MSDLSNQLLVERCINGDKGAWDKFVQRFSDLVFWAIRKKLSQANYHYGQQDIEDIFQNVFVLLWEKGKLAQIKNRENISTWLVMVAANCALNYFRNKREDYVVEEKLALEKIESSDCSAAQTVEQEKLDGILEEALNFLTPRERIILKLNYLHQKTHQEIGEILKIPTNTVSSLIKRAKEKLKQRLEKEGWQN